VNAQHAEPDLSVVVTTRNDNHGGDLNHRTQLFIDGLTAQAEHHRVHIELIVVEWNPPADRPPLAEALQWPEGTQYFDARIVVVPPSLHHRLAHSTRLHLFQMIAKNVGIRRARGRFVLATNIDVLFSHELIQKIGSRKLSHQALYRVDRYDVEADVPVDGSPDERLSWCEQHVLRVCQREGTLDLQNDHLYRIYEDLRVPLWFAGYIRVVRYLSRRSRGTAVFIVRAARAATRAAWRRARRSMFDLIARVLTGLRRLGRLIFKHDMPRRSHSSTRLVRRLDRWMSNISASLRYRAAAEAAALRRERRWVSLLGLRFVTPSRALKGLASEISDDWAMLRSATIGERARLRLHTNACGDFTLMSRESWGKIGGYPELELFSMHIDSLLLYQAHYSGVREAFIPHRLYHIEHAEGFKPDPESLDELNSRLEENAIPQISDLQFLDDVIEMYRSKRPKFRNPDTWGFSTESLGEHWVVQRELRESRAPAIAEEARS
jgi:hypothetical protein